jgi:hypothetical protein
VPRIRSIAYDGYKLSQEVMPMPRTLRMTFDGEVFRPNEPVNLQAGAEYDVTIHEATAAAPANERPLLRYLDLIEEVDLPPDFAAQHHHYLYGTPKR